MRSLILLSATINPSNLFLRSIGLDESSTVVHSATTNYKFRIRTVIDSGVTTRFKMRNAEMYSKIATRIAAVCELDGRRDRGLSPVICGVGIDKRPVARPDGNSRLDHPLRRRGTSWSRNLGLANEDSEEMMNTFKSNRGCVLLAVQGGRFSEGEDFPGDEMDVSIVVGLPLPPPSPTMYAEYRADGGRPVRQASSVHDSFPAAGVEEGLPVRRTTCARTRESRDGLLFGLAIRPAENDRFDASVVERRPPQRGLRARVDFLAYPRLLLERTGPLNWIPLRKAILAAARWSLVAPIAHAPASRTSRIRRRSRWTPTMAAFHATSIASLSEDLGSPPPIFTESDE